MTEEAADETRNGSSNDLKADNGDALRKSSSHHRSSKDKDRDKDKGLSKSSHRKSSSHNRRGGDGGGDDLRQSRSSHHHSRRGETEEERAERKRREREGREKETEEERAERKRRERERDTKYRAEREKEKDGGGEDAVDSKDPYGLSSTKRVSSRFRDKKGISSGDRAKSSRHLSRDDREGSSRHLSNSSRSKSMRHLSSEDKERSSRHLSSKDREKETEEERAERKRRERERDKDRDRDRRSTTRDKETEEERAERKRREREQRDKDRSPRRSSDKTSDRDREHRGSRRSSDYERKSSRKETEEERAERKKKEKEEREKEKHQDTEDKEREEKRQKEREERRKKDEEAKRERDKEREALREERRKEKEAKYGTKQTSLQVNRADLRSKNTERFNNVYSLGSLIYKSDDCKVHICHHRATGTERAVKITPKKLSSCHEFDMLKQADHPNVLTMYDLFDEEGPDGFEFYLVIDLCKGGTLNRILMKKLGKDLSESKKDGDDDIFGLGGFVSALTGQDEKEEEEEEFEADGYGLEESLVKKIMLQLLSCVNYLHKNKLVHADLKPQNILLPSRKDFDAIKVIDFDNSVLLRKADDKISSKKGTPEYMAPEVHAGQKYDYKCDIWSCGVIAYQLLSNSLPFGDSEEIGEEEVRKRIEEGTFKLAGPSWGAVSQEARDFVKYLLVVREKKRPTAQKALAHHWISPLNEGGDPNEGKTEAAITLDKDPSAMVAMSNFRKFNADTKLKKATCSFIASQLLTKEEKDKIDSIFRAMDITKDGKLSKTEVKAGFFQVFGTFMSDAEIDEIFARVDCDGTGEIEYSEFVIASMAETDLLSQDRLRKAFQLFDKDNSGSITISELREIFSFFQTAGADMDDAYIDSVIAAVDSDGNGDVSFDEFVEMMTSSVY